MNKGRFDVEISLNEEYFHLSILDTTMLNIITIRYWLCFSMNYFYDCMSVPVLSPIKMIILVIKRTCVEGFGVVLSSLLHAMRSAIASRGRYLSLCKYFFIQLGWQTNIRLV